MASLSPSTTAIPPHPSPAISAGATSQTSTPSNSSSESEEERPSRCWAERPRLRSRFSGTSIIPKGKETVQKTMEYPPDDARAMSPRRNSADLERLGREARLTLKSHAKSLQSCLQTLAEKIDEVISDHDRLESENKFLQDYIGGLTRTMSKGDIQSTSTVKGKK